MIPGLSTAKLIGLAIAAASILSFVLLAFHWKHEMMARGQQLDTICAATRAASSQSKLKCADVPKQIGFMGEAITTLTNAIHRQNAAVNALAVESDRQKQEAAKASRIAQERAGKAQGQIDRLAASSRSSERLAKPCLPSPALVDAWK